MASRLLPRIARLSSKRRIGQFVPCCDNSPRNTTSLQVQHGSSSHSYFSSVAVESSPKKRRSLAEQDPIVLTERAADRIKELLTGDSADGAAGIRLGVKRRGCNGLSYTLNYAYDSKSKDVSTTQHGVLIQIEPMALFNVVGTTMDWEETELASEFTFHNPNSKGECGCGESFNV